MNWSKSTTVSLFFKDVPVGTEFAFTQSGSIAAKRNVFTKIEPYTESAPNAASAASAKLKMWFGDEAVVRLPRPENLPEQEYETVMAEVKETARQKCLAAKRPSKYKSWDSCDACGYRWDRHEMRNCIAVVASKAQSMVTANMLGLAG